MRSLLQARVIVPLILGTGVLVLLAGSAGIERVLALVRGFQPRSLVLLLGLALLYEVVRTVQWMLLLRRLEPQLPWSSGVLSYMGGEVAKALPAGQYFQTYLLRQTQGMAVACSAAATTLLLWVELSASLGLVALLGLGAWTWVRLVAVGVLLGIGGVGVALRRRHASAPPCWMRSHARLVAAWGWYDRFAATAAQLLDAPTLGWAGLLALAYIACGAVSLWAVAAGLGVGALRLEHALAVYSVTLAVGLLVAVPVDVGLHELSGLAALLALGVPRTEALTLMLVQRVLGSVLSSGVALVVLTVLRRHLLRTLHGVGRPAAHEAPDSGPTVDAGCRRDGRPTAHAGEPGRLRPARLSGSSDGHGGRGSRAGVR